MRILRFGALALAAMVLLEGAGIQKSAVGAPFPLFAPVYAQSKAYRKAVRYSARHPFSLGSPVVVPVQTASTIPVRNVPTGFYSPRGYFYRASYHSPVMGGPAMNVPVLAIPETIPVPAQAIPVEPELIPAPRPVRIPAI